MKTKKKTIIAIISMFIIILSLASSISSCAGYQLPSAKPADGTNTKSTDDDEKIKKLESQIAVLLQNQQLSSEEQKKTVAQLKEQIEKIKNDSKNPNEAPSNTTTNTPPTQTTQSTFNYTVQNGKATITKINSDAENISIPATIDNYSVYSIGSDALCSNSVKTVTVSAGIEKIDWFAFKGCTSLSSISIPNSVLSIGYGAFDNTSRGLTIICSRNSFAHQYAQSYGITYDIN